VRSEVLGGVFATTRRRRWTAASRAPSARCAQRPLLTRGRADGVVERSDPSRESRIGRLRGPC